MAVVGFTVALRSIGAGRPSDIDWSTGSATPPADLTANGDRKVSDRALTLAGTLKGRLLYVGL